MKNLPLFSVLLLALVVFSGCPSGSDNTAEIEFKHKDNVVYARIPAEPDRLNPCLSTNSYSRMIHEHVFLSLLHFDPQTLELSPLLATSRPQLQETADGIAYQFEIHPEAVWEDGSPVTGHDYAFTIKAIKNPKVNAAHIRSYIEFISGVDVDRDNPKKFTVRTNGKYIIAEAVVGSLQPMPAYFYDSEGYMKDISIAQLSDREQATDLADNNENLQAFAEKFNGQEFAREKIAGCGAYKFVKWETGQQAVLEKKENWWGEGMAEEYPLLEAKPDKLVFKIIPDQTAMLAALKDQQIDVVSQVPPNDFMNLKQNDIIQKYYQLHNPSLMVYYYIGLNNKNPKLADKRVRQALAHLVNVDELIETLFYGLAERTIGPFHPAKPYYHNGLSPIAFNPEKARELLAEAGWEDTNDNGIVDKEIDGELVELTLDFNISAASEFSNAQSIILKDDAKKAGIDINIIPKDFAVLVQDTKRRDFEMYAGAWAQDPIVDDPKQLWHSESDTPDGGNRVSFNNVEADKLIEEIRVTLDEEKRDKLYKQFQALLYEEQPYIFLIAPKERIAISKRFEADVSSRRPGFFVNTFTKTEYKQ